MLFLGAKLERAIKFTLHAQQYTLGLGKLNDLSFV